MTIPYVKTHLRDLASVTPGDQVLYSTLLRTAQCAVASVRILNFQNSIQFGYRALYRATVCLLVHHLLFVRETAESICIGNRVTRVGKVTVSSQRGREAKRRNDTREGETAEGSRRRFWIVLSTEGV